MDIGGTFVSGSPKLTHILMSDQTGVYKDVDGMLLDTNDDLYIVPCGRERGEKMCL